MKIEIVAFDTSSSMIQVLREIKAPGFSIFEGNGIEATRAVNLDALWLTWMQAERFGITPLLEPHKAKVFPTPDVEVQKGFPPFIIAGVTLAPSDSQAAAAQLNIVLSAMADAVEEFHRIAGARLHRIGTIPEDLLLDKLSPEEATFILKAAMSEKSG